VIIVTVQNMFLKPNKYKLALFVIFLALGYLSYQYALNHLMDCFLSTVCQRSAMDYLMMAFSSILLLPVYAGIAILTPLVNPTEDMVLLNLSYSLVGLVYYYFLSCVMYTLFIKYRSRR